MQRCVNPDCAEAGTEHGHDTTIEAHPFLHRDEVLARAGVRVPSPYVRPSTRTFYRVKGRPRWLALLLRTLDRLNPFT